jgi:hypothetical protein
MPAPQKIKPDHEARQLSRATETHRPNVRHPTKAHPPLSESASSEIERAIGFLSIVRPVSAGLPPFT